MGSFVLLAAALGLPGPARAASSATLAGLDVYGTSRFSAADVEGRFRERILLMADAKNRAEKPPGASRRSSEAAPPRDGARSAAAKRAEELRAEIEAGIRKAWDLAWVRLTWMDYYTAASHTAFITVDVVEKGDAKTRLPFRRPPAERLQDPDGLLSAWSRYAETGWALVRSGQIPPDRTDCPAFYCQWGSRTPELKAFEETFASGVPPRKEALARILRSEKEPDRRANAAYLLAYIPGGDELSALLQDVLDDPEFEVRAAAMRIYSDLALYHRDVPLPIERIAAVLDYPSAEDRGKALAVLVSLADHPVYRPYVIHHAADQVLRLLRQRQPAVNDMAYTVLGLLSKEGYAREDYEAWEGWLRKAKAGEKDPGAPGPAKP